MLALSLALLLSLLSAYENIFQSSPIKALQTLYPAEKLILMCEPNCETFSRTVPSISVSDECVSMHLSLSLEQYKANIRVGLNALTLMFNQLSFSFSLDRKRNPEPWETVDPTVPTKVLLH